MTHSITILLVLVCTMCLATHHGQAKKGCKAYGYACYGGHGKRSIFGAVETEQNYISSPDAVLMLYSNKANLFHGSNRQVGEKETPSYRLVKILMPWLTMAQRKPAAKRFDASEYPVYNDDINNQEGILAKNNNMFMK
uniref:CCHamide-2 n=1 Tax=Glossina brevipalpis TaxID=37001 RepID=A0A1A9WQN3_9MUSC